MNLPFDCTFQLPVWADIDPNQVVLGSLHDDKVGIAQEGAVVSSDALHKEAGTAGAPAMV
jgi:hypothetical protein